MFQKAPVPFFTNANVTQMFFSIKCFFPKNGGKRFALAWALWAHPDLLEKHFVDEPNASTPNSNQSNYEIISEEFRDENIVTETNATAA